MSFQINKTAARAPRQASASAALQNEIAILKM